MCLFISLEQIFIFLRIVNAIYLETLYTYLTINKSCFAEMPTFKNRMRVKREFSEAANQIL